MIAQSHVGVCCGGPVNGSYRAGRGETLLALVATRIYNKPEDWSEDAPVLYETHEYVWNTFTGFWEWKGKVS